MGAQALGILNPAYLKLAVGLMVVVSAVLLLREDVRLPSLKTRWAPPVVGFASGVLASSTGLSGPPAALLTSRGLAKHTFRASIALFFLGLDGGAPGRARLLEAPAAFPRATGTPASSFADWQDLRDSALPEGSQETFRVVVLATAVLVGLMGVATAARALLA